MNLDRLFEVQRKLDEHIICEKGLEGQDLLPNKILALQVELGECANEWRGFKHWSKNQKPREVESSCTEEEAEYLFCGTCHKKYVPGEVEYCKPCNNALIPFKKRNPMLEEFVDCLHFILSIGLDMKFTQLSGICTDKYKNTTSQFLKLFDKIGDFSSIRTKGNYLIIWDLFIGLGEMLGFTWNQIEQAYFEKNKINHQRQEAGY